MLLTLLARPVTGHAAKMQLLREVPMPVPGSLPDFFPSSIATDGQIVWGVWRKYLATQFYFTSFDARTGERIAESTFPGTPTSGLLLRAGTTFMATVNLTGESQDNTAQIFERDSSGTITRTQVLSRPESQGVFGRALGDNLAVLGGSILNGAGVPIGVAYLFGRTQPGAAFEFLQQLPTPDGSVAFGASAAISGDRLVIGDWNMSFPEIPGDYSSPQAHIGAAWVFARNPTNGLFEETQRLTISDGKDRDCFGIAVAIVGDLIVASAPQQGTDSSGAVYTFRKAANGNQFTQNQKITDTSAPFDFAGFGESLAVTADAMLIGAPTSNHTPNVTSPGAAFLYHLDAATSLYQLDQIITGPSTHTARFGHSVALFGGAAAVGAPYDQTPVGGSLNIFGFPSSVPASTVASIAALAALLATIGAVTRRRERAPRSPAST